MARLQDKYSKEIVVKLQEKLGRKNVLSLPRLQKIVVNMGVGKALQDKNRMEQAAENLTSIAGQRCQITKARVAVSAFRLREGTLYPALHELELAGFVDARWEKSGRKRRVYRLTATGRREAKGTRREWLAVAEMLRRILRGADAKA